MPSEKKPLKKSMSGSEIATLDNVKKAMAIVSPKCHVVLFTEGELPVCQQLDSAQDAAALLRELVGTNTHAFVFRGERLPISAGPQSYLFDGPAKPIPLFDVPDPAAAAENPMGYLGMLDDVEEVESQSTTAGEPDEKAGTEPMITEDDAVYGEEPS